MTSTANTAANAGLPEKLLCDIAKHWATVDQFSKKNMETYRANARRNVASPANSGIPCRLHSGEQIAELMCEGICQKIRPLTWFSRNTRRTGRNICKDCADWYLSNEDGETLPPPPHSHAAEDEIVNVSNRMANVDLFQGPEAQTAIEAIMDDDDDPESLTTSQLDTPAPPHMSESASVITDNLQKAGTPFNAFGPNGERRTLVKVPTQSDTSASNTDKVKESVKTGKSGWAKPSQRKFEPKRPGYMVYGARATPAPQAKDDDGWLSDDHC